MTQDRNQDSISWGELAELTHATQVERFGFCGCEDNEGKEKPYNDCPKATYHGLIRVNCLACDYETQEVRRMEILNDMDGVCPECGAQFFRWINQNGSIVVSLTKNLDGLHTYDSLTFHK